MILEKMKVCLSKLELGFWTYGGIHLLRSSGPNVVPTPQTLRSKNFFRFKFLLDTSHDSGNNEVLFVKIGTRILGLWLGTSSRPK